MLVDRDRIRRPSLLDEPADGRVDQPMVGTVKVGVAKEIADAIPGRVVEQQATKNRGLRLYRLRREPQGGRLIIRHGRRPPGQAA